MFFAAFAFKKQVHVFAGRVKIVSHSSWKQVQYLDMFVPCHKWHLDYIYKGNFFIELFLNSGCLG